MPQASAFTINDGAATPVAHVFSPMGKDKNGVLWFIQTTPGPLNRLGAKRVGYKVDTNPGPTKQLTSVTKTQYSLLYPVLEVLGTSASGLTPPATTAYALGFRCAFERPDRALTQEAKDLRVLSANLLNHANTALAIDSNEPIYV